MLTITEYKGDIFLSPKNFAIIDYISLDSIQTTAMNYILTFNKKANYQLKKIDLGDIYFVEQPPRFIYHLIIKNHIYSKICYQSLKKSFKNLKNHFISNNITTFAINKIHNLSLENDLTWLHIEKLLYKIFDEKDIDMTLYIYAFE